MNDLEGHISKLAMRFYIYKGISEKSEGKNLPSHHF
jgi:hypothetical protein